MSTRVIRAEVAIRTLAAEPRETSGKRKKPPPCRKPFHLLTLPNVAAGGQSFPCAPRRAAGVSPVRPGRAERRSIHETFAAICEGADAAISEEGRCSFFAWVRASSSSTVDAALLIEESGSEPREFNIATTQVEANEWHTLSGYLGYEGTPRAVSLEIHGPEAAVQVCVTGVALEPLSVEQATGRLLWLRQGRRCVELRPVERIGHKARTFAEAKAWDVRQYAEMTPDERRAVAKLLRDRYYGTNCPDVRDAVAGARRRTKS